MLSAIINNLFFVYSKQVKDIGLQHQHRQPVAVFLPQQLPVVWPDLNVCWGPSAERKASFRWLTSFSGEGEEAVGVSIIVAESPHSMKDILTVDSRMA